MRSVLLLTAAVCLSAQPAKLRDTKLETRPVSDTLGKAVARISGPSWAGYEVPARARNFHDGDCACDTDRIAIYLRLENGAVTKVRMRGTNCVFDGAGLPLVWFTGVKPEDSAAYLKSLNHSDAVAALAQHDLPTIPALLVDLGKNSSNTKIRSQAWFWAAQRAGDKLAGEIRNAIENDPETDVKRSAVFALSQLPSSEGVPLLIDVARRNRNREVRRQAVFWLGQSKDERAFRFLEEVLAR